MNNPSSSLIAIEILDALEQREARLLVWGLADQKVGRNELETIADQIIDLNLASGRIEDGDAHSCIEALKQLGLIYEFEDPQLGQAYRSRMAETVRLMFKLRQLFPKHKGAQAWANARTLVGDYRFTWRRRNYPKRDKDQKVAIQEICTDLTDEGTKECVKQFFGKKGEAYRLAKFQVKSAQRILRLLESKRTAGTLVSAGTGSGKTLSFYLPALSRIASHILRDQAKFRWVKVLAIYPRTELLRDQFMETYREARRLDDFLLASGKRKIIIGALFGQTPHSARALQESPKDGWRKHANGYICGLMGCPADGCGGDLLWSFDLLKKQKESLTCLDCGQKVEDDEIILTRERLGKVPPDVLFSTTEMLNQRMADSRMRGLFGLRPQATKAPELVLLDEVHTYSGAHGAQVAYLLRRWTSLVTTPIHFVGLSATLRDAATFFARLTGLRENQVEEITPSKLDMTSEGAEYLLALRGDPVSRASLLSTTIQASMLLSRSLDTQIGQPSGGIYGNRIFAFTDDIDVTNRLYFDLLDAEGRASDGKIDRKRHPNGSLAGLREELPSIQRDLHGQNWRFLSDLGHELSEGKNVGRTSSQDPGVAHNLDVVVATASLEVGFNDPQVGAVIQHKAPRDAAQFLQRKGRAGRSRLMRPWTVVVLTDYGRDRMTYQNYDLLFDPELPRRNLPLSSRYIQRMQVVFAMIDYLGTLPGASGVGNLWYRLATPSTDQDRAKHLWVAEQLNEICLVPGVLELFEDFLSKSLGIAEQELKPLLWEYPRPLLTSAIPTAIRRLETNWRSSDGPSDFCVPNSPLPEFIPANLFSDLNLPEVAITLPKPKEASNETHVMPIAQALRTFAPGRVSRRFGISHRTVRHWVASGLGEQPETDLPLESSYDLRYLGEWATGTDEEPTPWPVYRPVEIRPTEPPKNVLDTSSGMLQWNTQIYSPTRGLLQTPTASSIWTQLLPDFETFSHGDLSSVEVRRFAHTATAEICFEKKDPNQTRFKYTKDGLPAALGFSMHVDGLCFRLSFPPELWRTVLTSEGPLRRSLRTSRFVDLVKTHRGLSAITNIFQRDWLAQIYLAAISGHSLESGVSLEESDRALSNNALGVSPAQILESIFQSSIESEGSAEGSEGGDRLRRDLIELLNNAAVVRAIQECARTALWETVDSDWEPWLRGRFKSTIAAAILESIQTLCPELDMTELIVDLEPGPRQPNHSLSDLDAASEIWITETSPGGAGLVEHFSQNYSEDPRIFFGLMSSCLEANEYEIVDRQLCEFLAGLQGDDNDSILTERVADFRAATTTEKLSLALKALRSALTKSGFVPFHGFISALNNRVLRPGSGPTSDAYLLHALRTWEQAEDSLGIELDARTFAYQLSRQTESEEAFQSLGLESPVDNSHYWRFSAIYGLLWARGSQLRRASLTLYNQFATLPETERLLVTPFLTDQRSEVDLTGSDWKTLTLQTLADYGTVRLLCPKAEPCRISEAINFLATNPVQSDYLSVFAKVTKMHDKFEHYELSVEIDEVMR